MNFRFWDSVDSGLGLESCILADNARSDLNVSISGEIRAN